MAQHKSAKKRIRQNDKRRIRNRHIRTTLRSTLKRFEQNLEEQNAEELKALVNKTVSTIDTAASKGVIHKNKAARHVSRIRRKINSLLTTSPSA